MKQAWTKQKPSFNYANAVSLVQVRNRIRHDKVGQGRIRHGTDRTGHWQGRKRLNRTIALQGERVFKIRGVDQVVMHFPVGSFV